MGDDEITILLLVAGAAGAGIIATSPSLMPRAFTERNPGIGLLRLASAFTILWTAYVIQFHGDPSITGIYIAFYVILAYSAAKIFGHFIGGWLCGIHTRSDIYERRNTAAAIVIAALIAAHGFLFGASLWGEADPLSDDEGGWWIPIGFFLMAWFVLFAATALYIRREPTGFLRQIRQERDTGLAISAAVYLLTCAYLLFNGVAGDFWGWRHGLFGMGAIALMLLGREIILLATSTAQAPGPIQRVFEQVLYVGLGAISWALGRAVDQAYIGG